MLVRPSAIIHAAPDGTVIVHVLSGTVTVSTPGETHALSAEMMLLLEDGVPHDVRALAPSRLLVTVYLRVHTPDSAPDLIPTPGASPAR